MDTVKLVQKILKGYDHELEQKGSETIIRGNVNDKAISMPFPRNNQLLAAVAAQNFKSLLSNSDTYADCIAIISTRYKSTIGQ